VREKLLTPKGLRSLSPDNPLYCGHYVGDQTQRDRAYHNGTVWVWLLEHYFRGRFRLEGAEFIPEARQIIHNFLPDIDSYGIATLAEIYDGDAPHSQRGAISQAWSVAAILEIQRMIENNQR
jgi:glycogen debranching enzyme